MYVPELNQGHPHGYGVIHQSMKVSPDEDNDSHSQHPPVVNSSSERARDPSTHPSSLRQDLSLTPEFEISADREVFKILQFPFLSPISGVSGTYLMASFYMSRVQAQVLMFEQQMYYALNHYP